MLPAKPFYLIRHGQSEANAAHITAGGSYDSPLTEKGRNQAKALAPFLDQLPWTPTVIHHSGMLRARDTAAFLNQTLKLEMIENRDLREHEMGAWDGLGWAEVEPLLEAHQSPPGGENDSMFAQRIQSALTDVLNASESPPMVVAHGGLFHAIGFMYEYAMSEVQNCTMHYFEPNTEWDVFPWRVWRFDVVDTELVKVPAPFCLSQTMEKIA